MTEKEKKEERDNLKKILSKLYNKSENDIIIDISDEASELVSKTRKETLNTVSKIKRKSKADKLLDKISFLKQCLADGAMIQKGNEMEHWPIINDKTLREQLQYQLMDLIMQYLKC